MGRRRLFCAVVLQGDTPPGLYEALTVLELGPFLAVTGST